MPPVDQLLDLSALVGVVEDVAHERHGWIERQLISEIVFGKITDSPAHRGVFVNAPDAPQHKYYQHDRYPGQIHHGRRRSGLSDDPVEVFSNQENKGYDHSKVQ